MPAETRQKLQDVFLDHVRKNKVPVTAFLSTRGKSPGSQAGAERSLTRSGR